MKTYYVIEVEKCSSCAGEGRHHVNDARNNGQSLPREEWHFTTRLLRCGNCEGKGWHERRVSLQHALAQLGVSVPQEVKADAT